MYPIIFPIPFFNRFFGQVHGDCVSINENGVAVGNFKVAHTHSRKWNCQRCWFWKRVTLVEGGKFGFDFLLHDANAVTFIEHANSFWARSEHLDSIKEAALRLHEWEVETKQARYLPRHRIDAWIAAATPVNERLSSHIPALRIVDPHCPSVQLAAALENPFEVAAKTNLEFVSRELARLDSWFGTFERPPTPTQREIAIRDETNSLVVAGAGTGKTSAIVAKVRYLLREGIAAPHEILILAFNADAAEEIRERCAGHGADAVTVRTFHALGLEILGNMPREKPPLLSELTTDESRASLIEKLIAELCINTRYGELYAKFLVLYPRPLVNRFESSSEAQFISRSKVAVTRSLSGHWVRSSEELRIADWLFTHGITFEYEKNYPFDTSGANRTRYRPDFTISRTEIDTHGEVRIICFYLEHQALNERGEAPEWMGDRYTEKVEWARATHRKNNTTLVESFSWWFQKGVWEDNLGAALKRLKIPVKEVDWLVTLNDFEHSQPKRFQADRRDVLKLIQRTLDLIRCTTEKPIESTPSDARPLEKITSFLFNHMRAAVETVRPPPMFDVSRETLFEEIFRPVQAAYDAHKKKRGGIDFEDMIFLARRVAASGSFKAPWSHYIVDEFQDASLSRLELVQSLRKQRWDSRLVCIGDDWQAIIRFAGGDIRVMTQFAQRIGPFWQANLGQTFRYSPTIAAISSAFIVENPDQLKKSIVAAPGSKNLPVRIVLAAPIDTRVDGEKRFNDVLSTELKAINELKADASVLLLSRYRRGIPPPDEQESIKAAFPTLKLIWSTVHRSKGREADAVIVADLDDDPFGFPCLREDDPIIRKYLPPEDSFEHAEERRLFYVAMTRAKHRLTLIANAQAPSPFIVELIQRQRNRPGLQVISSGDPTKACPLCKAGFLIARDGTNGRFYSCTKFPVCPHKEQACPTCRRGFLFSEAKRFVCSKRDAGCDHMSRICPRCEEGALILRTNRQRGNQFWGCSRFNEEDEQCKYTLDA